MPPEAMYFPMRVTQRLHKIFYFQKAKSPVRRTGLFALNLLGWPMGLEPTTTGITILNYLSFRASSSALGW